MIGQRINSGVVLSSGAVAGAVSQTQVFTKGVSVGAPTLLTISAGSVTATTGRHSIEVESGTTDDLNSIAGGTAGQLLLISSATGWPIVVKHNVGNIALAGGSDVTLSGMGDMLFLRYDATLSRWIQTSTAAIPAWLLYDQFTTIRAVTAVNGTAAEPGPGTRVVVDTESKLSIT